MADNPYDSPSHRILDAEVIEPSGTRTDTSFELTPDIMVSFVDYHRRASPANRRGVLTLRLLVIFIGLLLLLYVAAFANTLSQQILGFGFVLLMVGALLGLLPYVMTRAYRNAIRKTLSQGKNRSLEGLLHITLTDEGVQSETNLSRSIYKWPAIEKIVETQEHLFLYVSGYSAIVVPKRSFQSEHEAQGFIETARLRSTEAEYVADRKNK